MNNVNWKRTITHIILLFFITFFFLISLNIVLIWQEKETNLKERDSILRRIFPAASYVEYTSESVFTELKRPEYILGLYGAFDEAGESKGLLLRIAADLYYEGKIFHLVFDETGTFLNFVGIYDEMGNLYQAVPESFAASLYNVRLPVVSALDMEKMQSATIPVLDGL